MITERKFIIMDHNLRSSSYSQNRHGRYIVGCDSLYQIEEKKLQKLIQVYFNFFLKEKSFK